MRHYQLAQYVKAKLCRLTVNAPTAEIQPLP